MPASARRSPAPQSFSPASALTAGALPRLLWAAGALGALWLSVWWALA